MLGKAMEAGEVQREDRGRYIPTGSQSYLGELRVLPTPDELTEFDPDLGIDFEVVDPITGQVMRNAK